MTHQPAEEGNKFVGNIAPPAYDNIDDHGTTGSSEHLLPPPTGHQMPPPTWGQMPPPPQGQPQPRWNTQPMLPGPNIAQPVNDPGWRVPVENLDDRYLQLPVTRPPNFHTPQNLICPTCNHQGPTVVRLKRGPAVKGWAVCCGVLAICWLFPIAGLLISMGFECKKPGAYSCPLLVFLGVLMFPLIFFCCLYPCCFRRFWDAYQLSPLQQLRPTPAQICSSRSELPLLRGAVRVVNNN